MVFTHFRLFIALILAVGSIAQAKPYDFKALYNDLKYTPTYFGAPTEEVESLRAYIDKQSDFYVEINSYLRKSTADQLDADIHSQTAKDILNISRLIQTVPPLPSDIILFRGMTLNWHKNNSPFEIGEEYVDKAFSSTSTNMEVAANFAIGGWYPSSANFKDETAIMTLYFQTSDARGILIDQGEDEVLLNYGLRFRIMKKKVINEANHYLVQICQKVLCDTKVTRTDVLEQWMN